MKRAGFLLAVAAACGCASPRQVVDIHGPVTMAEVEAYAGCGADMTEAELAACDCAVERALALEQDDPWPLPDIVVMENLADTPMGQFRYEQGVRDAERRDARATRAKERHLRSLVRRAAASCSATPAASPV